jgi:hypothetical protein
MVLSNHDLAPIDPKNRPKSRRAGGERGFVQGFCNQGENAIHAVQDLVISEAQDAISKLLQKGRPPPIMRALGVGPVGGAVHFNDDHSGPAGKIREIGADGMLAHELHAA